MGRMRRSGSNVTNLGRKQRYRIRSAIQNLLVNKVDATLLIGGGMTYVPEGEGLEIGRSLLEEVSRTWRSVMRSVRKGVNLPASTVVIDG